MKGIMIAAPQSGSGKTVVTCGILGALKKRGIPVVSCKCGPDYIDPMFHRSVLGIPSMNLDGFFCTNEELQSLVSSLDEESFCIAEGVMGLYDGLGGVSKEASSYAVAQALQMPVILVINARGMGRTVISLLKGILQDDESGLIAGVILNKVSKGWYPVMANMIEEELSLPVFGFLPMDDSLVIKSRHLGLMTPHDLSDVKETLDLAATAAEQCMDLNLLMKTAGELAVNKQKDTDPAAEISRSVHEPKSQNGSCDPVRIAVAEDEAFCFLYEENKKVLESFGAKLIPFSPLHDKSLPENVSGIYLCGGYPELYLKELSENTSMTKAVRCAVKGGMPSIAECGGFMYLQDAAEDEEGIEYPLCGVVQGKAVKQKHLVRFGYITLQNAPDSSFLAGETIRGHEFHYYDVTDPGSCVTAEKPVSGKTRLCIHAGKDHWWGFPHLYYPNNTAFARRFVEAALRYSSERKEI